MRKMKFLCDRFSEAGRKILSATLVVAMLSGFFPFSSASAAGEDSLITAYTINTSDRVKASTQFVPFKLALTQTSGSDKLAMVRVCINSGWGELATVDNTSNSGVALFKDANANSSWDGVGTDSLVTYSLAPTLQNETGLNECGGVGGKYVDLQVVTAPTYNIPSTYFIAMKSSGTPVNNNTVNFKIQDVQFDPAGSVALSGDTGVKTVTMDTQDPGISLKETKDLDGNGLIDAVKITMDESVLDSTIATGDFALGGGYTIASGYTGTKGGIAFTSGVATSTANDAVFYLAITEGSGGPADPANCSTTSTAGCDTDQTPTLAYNAGTLTDHVGNLLPTAGAAATSDKALPIQKFAKYKDTNTNGQIDRVDVSFSENVVLGTTVDGDVSIPTAGTINVSAVTGVAVNADDLRVSVTADANKTGGVINPTISYASGAGKLADASGNLVATFNALDVGDASLPQVVSSGYLDTNHNGRIDTVEITLTEDQVGSDAVVGDFTYTANDITNSDLAGGSVSFATANKVILTLGTEGDVGITSHTIAPTIQYVDGGATGVTDANGAELASFGPANLSDIATPVIMSASYKDTNTDGQIDRVDVVFSEDVSTSTFTNGEWSFPTNPQSIAVSGGVFVGNDARITVTGAPVSTTVLGATQIKYTAGTGVIDADSNASATSADVTVSDAAEPILLSSQGLDAGGTADVLDAVGDFLEFRFSEPMAMPVNTAAIETALTFAGGATDGTNLWDGVTENTVSLENTSVANDTIRVTHSGTDSTNLITSGVNTVRVMGAGILGADGLAPSTTPAAIGITIADLTPPTIAGVADTETQDVDLDGKIDFIKVTFTDANDLDSSITVDETKITVAGYTPLAFANLNCAGRNAESAAVMDNKCYSSTDGKVLYLPVEEKLVNDTDAVPNLSIAASSNIADVFGNSFTTYGPSVTTDSVSPVFESAETLDNNNDGTVDYVKIIYSEAVSDASIVSGDYQAGIADTTAGNLTETFTSGVPAGGNETDTPNDDTVYVAVSSFGETLSANKTDYQLKIQQTGNIDDANANTLTAFALQTSSDKSAPVIASASYKDIDTNGQVDRVDVVFSEDISASVFTGGDWSFSVNPHTLVVASGSISGSTAQVNVTGAPVAGANSTNLTATSIQYTAGTSITDGVNASQTSASTSVDDATAPFPVSAVYKDVDADGQVDRLDITFSENIVNDGYDDADYATAVAGTIGLGDETGITTNSADLRIAVDGTADITGGITNPQVSYTNNFSNGARGLNDAGNNPVQNFTVTATDGAGPIPVSATISKALLNSNLQTGAEVEITFSEAITIGAPVDGNFFISRNGVEAMAGNWPDGGTTAYGAGTTTSQVKITLSAGSTSGMWTTGGKINLSGSIGTITDGTNNALANSGADIAIIGLVGTAIDAIAVTAKTDNSATIEWVSSTASTSNLVKYGVTSALGSQSIIGAPGNGATAHSINLSGLTANTLYYYQVCSTDGSQACSAIQNFTTSITLEAIAVTAKAQTTATIEWISAVNTTANKVKYGTTSALGSQSVAGTPGDGATAHSINLSGLTANTLYYYQVCSTDATETCSTIQNFTTNAVVADTTAPTVSYTAIANQFTQSTVPASIAFTLADNTAVTTLTLDDGATTSNIFGDIVGGVYTLALSSTIGLHEYVLTAGDAVGNVTAKTITYNVVADATDIVAPTIAYTHIANQYLQSAVPANIAFTLADNTAVTTLTLDNGATTTNVFGDIAGGVYTMALSSTLGLHEYTVTAGDAAGNLVAKTVTYNVVADDTTSPTITYTTIDNQFTQATVPASIAFTLSDDVAVTGLTMNNGATTTNVFGSIVGGVYTMALSSTLGLHEYVITASDAQGHSSQATVTYNVAVNDAVAPVVTYTRIANQFTQSAVPANIVLTISDNTAVTTLTLDNGATTTNVFGSIVGGDYTLALSSTIGLHEYIVTAGDAAGNTTAKTIVYNVVADPSDTTAPTVSYTAIANQFTQSAVPANIAFTLSDDTAVTTLTINSGATTSNIFGDIVGGVYTLALSNTVGLHEYTITAGDAAGNTTIKTVTYNVVADPSDVTAPTIAYTHIANQYLQSAVPANIAFTLSDDTAVTTLTLDNGATTSNIFGDIAGGVYTLVLSSAIGLHEYTITAGDAAGNLVAKTVTYNVVANDTTSPVIAYTTIENQYLQSAVPANIAFTLSDDTAVTSLTLNNGSSASSVFGSIVGGVYTLALSNTVGLHEYVLTAGDAQGHSSQATVTYNVTTNDATAPVIAYTRIANQFIQSAVPASIAFTLSDNTAVTTLTLDNGATNTNVFGDIAGGVYTLALSNTVGLHEYVLTAGDAVGNTTAKTVVYSVSANDTTAPGISYTPIANQFTQSTVPANIVLTISDDTAVTTLTSTHAGATTDVFASLVGGAYTLVLSNTLGLHQYTITAGDAIGHSTSSVITYNVVANDTTAPTIAYTHLANQYNQSAVPSNVAFTLADNTAVTALTLNNGVTTTDVFASIVGGVYTLTLSNTLGLHEYVLTASDAAGNPASVTVTYNVLADAVTNVEITGYTVSSLTSTGFTLAWTTSATASSSVIDVLTSGYSSLNQGAVIATTNNTITVASLSANTTYTVIMKSKVSGQSSYTTVSFPLTTATNNTSVLMDGISMTKSYATADDSYANGWEWKFNFTVNNPAETGLKMKFAQWTGTTGSLNATNNMRYAIDANNDGTISGAGAEAWTTIDANGAYPATATTFTGVDNNTLLGGRQVSVYVQIKVPVGTPGGSYSTSYGIQTN